MRRLFKRERGRGFTLVEALVALMLFGLFGLAAVSSLTMAVRQWGILSKKVNASQNARFVAGIITTELRQGCPNPTQYGYVGAGLDTATAVLMPNTDQVTTNELIFNEPDMDVYDPVNTSWADDDVNSYRTVRYFVRNNTEVVRETTSFQNGSPGSPAEEVIARGEFIELEFTYINEHNIIVRVLARQGQSPGYFYEAEYFSQAYIIGS